VVDLTVVDLTVVDLPSDSAIAEALSAAGSAHHEYEQTALKGVHDGL